MQKTIASHALVLLLTVAFMTATGRSQEQSIRKNDVPAAILEAFQKSYPKAAIKGYAKEVEHDTLKYEIESTEGKVHRDVTYLADGTMVSVEETLPYKDLPEAVRKSLDREYPNAKVNICEKIMKGSTVQYELLIRYRKEKFEVLFNPDGTIVKTEKK